MNKKLLIISILAVFMLLAISFASAVNTNTAESAEKKQSPLFRVRIRQAIKEKIGNVMTRFIGERTFFLPFKWLRMIDDLPLRQLLETKVTIDEGPYTCDWWTSFRCNCNL